MAHEETVIALFGEGHSRARRYHGGDVKDVDELRREQVHLVTVDETSGNWPVQRVALFLSSLGKVNGGPVFILTQSFKRLCSVHFVRL